MEFNETCYYCDALLPARRELDHFPLPSRFGGKTTVAACMNCHDLKDRSVFDDWPSDYLLGCLASLSEDTLRLTFSLFTDPDSAEDTITKLLDDWNAVPTRSRVALAKIIRIAVARIHADPDLVKRVETRIMQTRNLRVRELDLALRRGILDEQAADIEREKAELEMA